MKHKIFIPFLICFSSVLIAQDPHFTQFYAAPLSVNPAYTGVFNGRFRVISNFRQQWINSLSAINTSSVSIDGKIGKQNKETGQSPINIGLMLMNDNSMKGAFKSNYITSTFAYHVPLDPDQFHSMGVGFAATYGDRRIDFSSISFSDQFTSGGFDLTLPTGESALNNMQPFFTIGAGLLYKYDNQEGGTFIDLGISGYHFNKPKQSVLNDKNQYLPVRYSAQASLKKFISNTLILNVKALYQSQASVNYFLGGLSIAKLLGAKDKNMVGIGLWYRTFDAISPYVLLEFNKFQIGISYDVTTSDLKKGPKPVKSIELSLQFPFGEKNKIKN